MAHPKVFSHPLLLSILTVFVALIPANVAPHLLAISLEGGVLEYLSQRQLENLLQSLLPSTIAQALPLPEIRCGTQWQIEPRNRLR
jgi:hypothetical protein